MNGLERIGEWLDMGDYKPRASAQRVMAFSACGSACGAADPDKKDAPASACGSACGAADPDKKEAPASACGSACGAADPDKK